VIEALVRTTAPFNLAGLPAVAVPTGVGPSGLPASVQLVARPHQEQTALRLARAIERGETAGLMKLVVDASNDRVLGASVLASEGGELVQILSTLMLAKQPYTLLKGAIYIHPTLAEGFFSLMEDVKPVD